MPDHTVCSVYHILSKAHPDPSLLFLLTPYSFTCWLPCACKDYLAVLDKQLQVQVTLITFILKNKTADVRFSSVCVCVCLYVLYILSKKAFTCECTYSVMQPFYVGFLNFPVVDDSCLEDPHTNFGLFMNKNNNNKAKNPK